MLLRSIAEKALNRIAATFFPAVLLSVSVAAGLWQFERPAALEGVAIEMRAWQQPEEGQSQLASHAKIAAQLAVATPTESVFTHRSTGDFWFALAAKAPVPGAAWAIEFPSRHTMEMECWDRKSDLSFGKANRDAVQGRFDRSRAGFAIGIPASQQAAELLCRAAFRGPAKISAVVWTEGALEKAQTSHERNGAVIDAGLGMLALSMLLMAIINRNALYFAFVGWLLLSLRMAALSAGTDFNWFGSPIPSSWLIETRQWTICMYSTATVALFGQLFRR